MDKDPESRSVDANTVDVVQALKDRPAVVEWLYAQANAARWGLSRGHFAAALERSAKKRLASGAFTAPQLEEYLGALHLEDLALASACAEGCEAAWEHFVTTFRGYLRAAAAAILRCKAGSADACELYGLAGGKGAERSLFRYFQGRSSLKTWLRAVLAQRHIDAIRTGRRFEELGEDETGDGPSRTLLGQQMQPGDPHRERYIASFTLALQTALERLEPQEKERLRLYYAGTERCGNRPLFRIQRWRQPHRFGKIAAAPKIAGPGSRKADAVTARCKKAVEFRSKDGEAHGA